MLHLLIIKAMNETSFGKRFLPNKTTCSNDHQGTFHVSENLWLVNYKRFGPKNDDLTDNISITQRDDGAQIASTANEEKRKKALALRYDPYVSAQIEIRNIIDVSNRIKPANQPDYKATAMDIYLEHNIGLSKARKFLTALHETPDKRIDEIFEDPASLGNKTFFKNKESEQWFTVREANQAYNDFTNKQLAEHAEEIKRLSKQSKSRTASINVSEAEIEMFSSRCLA